MPARRFEVASCWTLSLCQVRIYASRRVPYRVKKLAGMMTVLISFSVVSKKCSRPASFCTNSSGARTGKAANRSQSGEGRMANTSAANVRGAIQQAHAGAFGGLCVSAVDAVEEERGIRWVLRRAQRHEQRDEQKAEHIARRPIQPPGRPTAQPRSASRRRSSVRGERGEPRFTPCPAPALLVLRYGK